MPNRKVSDDGSFRFTVTVPLGVVEQLRAIADERGAKLAAVMREAAFFYLKHHRQPRSRAS